MTFLLSSLVLLLGPFLFVLGQRHAGSRQALDGFVLISIAGIVCLHIVPEAWLVAGVPSLVFLLSGLVFPLLLEKAFSRAVDRAHLVVLSVAASGLALHAVLDGFALLPVGDQGLFDNELALSVIIHRLPVGMAIWWALRPQFGVVVAIAAFLIVIGATGLSYSLGADLVDAAQTRNLAFFQTFVAGSLVHVALFGISHEHTPGHDHARASGLAAKAASWPFRVGLLLGLVMLFLLPHLHD